MQTNRYRAGMVCFICGFNIVASFATDSIDSIVSPGVIFELLALNRDLPTPATPKYRSPTDLVPSPDGRYIYICEQTAKRIAVFDVGAGAVQRYFRLPNEVTGCAVAPDGKTVYATCSSDIWPRGIVCIVNSADGRVVNRIAVGSGVRAPVITPDGKKLIVCNRFDNNVSLIDIAARREIARVAAVREPYCAAITPDGKTVVVGNLLSGDIVIDTANVASQVTIIDVPSAAVTTNVRLTRGSTSVVGMALSPDGRYAFATHNIGHFYLVGSKVENGWLHTNNIAIIDVPVGKLVNEISLDRDSIGAGNPWGIRCTDDGRYLVAALAGCNELAILRLPEMMDTVSVRVKTFVDMHRDFSLIRQTGIRIPVATKGPRACAIIGDRVFTAGYFDDSTATMEAFVLSDSSMTASRYQIGDPQIPTGERIGEGHFYDATICLKKWQSCSSCHPFGRNDGLNWILGGSAVPAPKNTKSLVCSWWTSPFGWGGRRGHSHAPVQYSAAVAIQLELFRQPSKELSAPIDTFLMGMKPVPSPMLAKGMLSEPAKRGKLLFGNKEKTDCRDCHPAPLFTDEKLWNTGIPDPYDPNTQIETPGWPEAWRTGPYGHLGSFGTVRELCTFPGHSKVLEKSTDGEINDLVEYVKSL